MNNVEKILDKFDGFTDGVRMLMLCHRNKEGGSNNERQNIRRVSRNEREFIEILDSFLTIKKEKNLPLRIYSCLNKRDIKSAIRLFKYKQLDAEYNNNEEVQNFYFDIKNRWVSALMKPQSRLEKNFLFDIDEGDEKTIKDFRIDIAKVTRNYKIFETKHGHHAVTQPFNPQLMPGYEINKDGLLLLDY